MVIIAFSHDSLILFRDSRGGALAEAVQCAAESHGRRGGCRSQGVGYVEVPEPDVARKNGWRWEGIERVRWVIETRLRRPNKQHRRAEVPAIMNHLFKRHVWRRHGQ